AFLEQGLADRQGQIPQLVVGRGDRNRQNLRFLRPFEGLVTAAAVFQQGVGDQMGQGAELQIPLVAASALSRPEIFQPGIVHREVQQSPHRVGQGELLQHRCRKNVAVHNSKDSWVNSRRCQIGTYDTDFVSAEKRQHPELTGQEAALRALRHAQDVDSVQDRNHADHDPPDNWQGVGQDIDSGPDHDHGDDGSSDNWQEVGQDVDSRPDHDHGDDGSPDNWQEVGQDIDSRPDHNHGDDGSPDNWQEVARDIDSGPDHNHGGDGSSDNSQEIAQDVDSGPDRNHVTGRTVPEQEGRARANRTKSL